jgi:hypothetical protein
MSIRRAAPQASLSEVLDRVLDRGIVIDAWLRVSVVGIDLIDVDARVVVASIDTYVRQSEALAHAGQVSRPAVPRKAAPARLPELDEACPAAEPSAARPRRRRPPRRLRCLFGCTFVRAANRCPATVRCPSDRSRTCPVTAISRAA